MLPRDVVREDARACKRLLLAERRSAVIAWTSVSFDLRASREGRFPPLASEFLFSRDSFFWNAFYERGCYAFVEHDRANSTSVSDFHPDTLVMTLEEIKVRSIATVAGGYAIILLLNVTATGKITLAGRR